MLFDPGFAASSSVVQLGHAPLARERVAYPQGGKHSLQLSEKERRSVRRRWDGLTVSGFLRRAVLGAAGLPACGLIAGPAVCRLGPRVDFRLSRDERAAVDAALCGRDLTAWMHDAVRHAAGWRRLPWTDCGEALLRRGFRRMDLAVLLRALPGRTSGSLYARAERLGLDARLSDERLTVHGAAALAGVDDQTVRRVLARQGFAVATMAGKAPDAAHRYRIVRREDVVRAVTEDSRLEDVQTAADRLRRAPAALRKALLRAGHERPPRGRRWRLLPEVFDQAAATIRGKGGR